MWGLPSFLAWPFALPHLPSISLPANIQRRFLSYVLKRTLGQFVKAGGLDVERIQAQISEGWVEIEGLEVDTDAINELLPPGVPLTIASGALERITARVPFPNLWSDPLALTLETLTLDLDLLADPSSRSRSTSAGNSPRRPYTASTPFSPMPDLAASVTSAADEFLHEELDAYEEAQLDRSIRDTLTLSASTPTPTSSGGSNVPGAFPFPNQSDDALSHAPSTTVLAGLIERVLARLQLRVENVRIRIRSHDREHGCTLEVRVAEIRYADESDSRMEAGQQGNVRAVRISGLQVYMLPGPPSAVPTPSQHDRRPCTDRRASSSSSSTSRSTDSASSDSGSHDDPSADMAMSMAVADLRESTASFASGASVYESAHSEQFDASPRFEALAHAETLSASVHSADTDRTDQPRSRTATPISSTSDDQREALLLSFVQDDVVLQMRTIPPRDADSGTRHDRPAVEFAMSMGGIACLLAPDQVSRITAAALIATRSSARAPASGSSIVRTTDAQKPSHQAAFSASLDVRSVHAMIIYDTTAEQQTGFDAAAQLFWQRPSSAAVPYGHVKLRLESIEAGYGAWDSGATSSDSRTTSATITATVKEASLFEYIAAEATPGPGDDDLPPGESFPILVFDANLPQQYETDHRAASLGSGGTSAPTATSSPTFREFATVDWRNTGLQRKAGTGEKAWKVKPRIRSALKTEHANDASRVKPVVQWTSYDKATEGATLELQPIHIFLDLSLVERLLPMLRAISPAFKHSRTQTTGSAAHSPSVQSGRMTNHFGHQELGGQTASTATIQGDIRHAVQATIACTLIRLDIRCPAPPSRRGTWGESGHLRSGIVTLDILRLNAKVLSVLPPDGQRVSFGAQRTSDVGRISAEQLLVYFCRASEKKSVAFLVLAPLQADGADDADATPLLPAIAIQQTTSTGTAAPMQAVTCRIPSVRANIRQTTIEGLQFFADDMAQWLDGAFGDASAPKPKDDLKMIGSRFFGSKASSSASSSAVEDEEEEEVDDAAATRFRLLISETAVDLHVPRKRGEPSSMERVLSLCASDLDGKVESNVTGKQETLFTLAILNLNFSDRSDPARPARILGRTTPLSLTQDYLPLLSLRFSSSTDPQTGAKETGIKVVCSGWTFFVTKDLAWIGDLKRFAKTPEGVFEDMTPSEVTRIQVQLQDCSVHVAAPTLPGGLVAVLGDLDVRTDLISDADEQNMDLAISRSFLFAVDNLGDISPLPVGHQHSHEAWRRAGWAQMVELPVLDVHVGRDLSGAEGIGVDVLAANLRLTGCADSLSMIGQLAGDMANLAPGAGKAAVGTKPPPPAVSLDQPINVFASLDEEAFRKIPDLTSGADMIDDDLPTNLDYLDAATKQPANEVVTDATTGESLRSWQTEDENELAAEGGSTTEGTIRILLHEPFVLDDEDYWDNIPSAQESGIPASQSSGMLRVRVHNASVAILLHDGYDWQQTRKTIADEMKAVRRRLEKIKQLLASGQKADDSIERTNSLLYNSIYIGLDQSQADLDPAALLAAIDDELDALDGGADTASQSSWQSFPTVRGRPTLPASTSKARLRGKRLTRSKKAQVEIALNGLRGDVDVFGATAETASKVEINVQSLEILDHIKTSTWKKFLTEMKADSRGNVRETGADMVRLSMTTVRPSLPSLAEEVRLKAKILPLRLHVDQDALDFLKRLGNFKPAATDSVGKGPPSPPATRAAPASPFFQHVEVYPVQLKLDYKPKRVDFNALREGKTIELMNFFHFDGAEMTLRHITLSGVAGWDRLSTLLQDTWTPDVKANQLADVISGVSPIRSVVNVGSGVADLILLPIEQYRKDGRIAKGIQRGTNSFVKSTALEMMKLGAKLATGTQVVLEKAESVLGGKMPEQLVGEVERDDPTEMPGYSPGLGDGFEADDSGSDGDDEAAQRKKKDASSRYARQPENATEGVQAAYKSLSRNINSAAQTILAVPMEVYERSGEDGPLKAVVRAVPIAVLKPMIGATEAVSKTLLGVRNSLDPEARRQLDDKYK